MVIKHVKGRQKKMVDEEDKNFVRLTRGNLLGFKT